jgi:ABC-2 type transport system permease protein
MRPFHLIGVFIRASLQRDLAYRSNFWITLLHSLLNLGVGVLGMVVLFSQVQTLQGWTFSAALALLGVYLVVSALRGLFIGPSLESLAGLGQEIVTGNFDFTLLRPRDTQFLISFREWRLFASLDLLLGMGVLGAALLQGGQSPQPIQWLAFGVALASGVLVLYSILLVFASLVFWSPGFLFTWVFDALFQLARYPVNIYPNWLRFLLTWIVPVGVMTTIPAQALTGQVAWQVLGISVLFSALLLVLSSLLFRRALRRYSSASS